MPPPKRVNSTASSPVAAKKVDTTTTSRNGPRRPVRRPIVPKQKSAKKAAPGQANTLFDFYPNLSKNAPLFRAPLAGDEPDNFCIRRSNTETDSVVTDDYDNAMSVLEQEDFGKSEDQSSLSGLSPLRKPQEAKDEQTNTAFGPFSLDDDDDDDETSRVLGSMQQETSTTGKSPSNVRKYPEKSTSSRSDCLDSLSTDSSISGHIMSEKYATTIADQIQEYRDGEGEEIELEEERDRFENADDEVNEDESWSWQEYNAENFGASVSRDEEVLCPVCGESIISLAEHDRSAHVNRCLDLPEPRKDENQVDGKALIDATVKHEMEAQAPVIKQEPQDHVEIKTEQEDLSPRIKMEDEIEEFLSTPEIKDEVLDDIKEEPFVKAEAIDVKPRLSKDASNAFEKIMVNHTEEKQWADAARTENAQRGTKYKTRVCPFYKILSPFPIAVDAFKYGTVPGVQGYYLTHFHSDHYGGLSSTWDAGPIYCSTITGSLVIQQLKVRPEYVVKLPMNSTNIINGMKITLIDANHCPGSTLFLFEGTARGRSLRYLHCGDFRATPTQLLHPAVRGKKIDSLYLDTTYLSPKYAFPSQEDVIEACSHVCRDLAGLLPEGSNPVADARNSSGMAKFLNQKSMDAVKIEADDDVEKKKSGWGRLLVVVGTYSIGKERIVLGIAKALNSKIFAAQRKRDILACLEDAELEARITDDPREAQVHMTYLQEIRAETLSDYLTQFHPHFGRIVGFRGTGWTYTPPKTRFLDNPSVEQIMSWNPRYTFHNMSPGRGSSRTSACYGVPYSEHSSFRELMCFCLSAELGRVIPTVNVGSERSRKLMKSWIDKWALEVRKNGLRALTTGQTEWT